GTAGARSAGSGDQPGTVAMPARFASSASEPPIAPRPRMPRLEGRTGRKLAVNAWGVNEKGGHLRPPSLSNLEDPQLGPDNTVIFTLWKLLLSFVSAASLRSSTKSPM